MILIKLEGQEQISKFWPKLRDTIQDSLPDGIPKDSSIYTYYIQSLMSETLQAWLGFSDDQTGEPLCCLITAVVFDPAAGCNTLMVCFAKRFSRLELKEWVQAKDTLAKYAKAKGCVTITGYTTKDSFLYALIDKLGASANYILVSIPVVKTLEIKQDINGVFV